MKNKIMSSKFRTLKLPNIKVNSQFSGIWDNKQLSDNESESKLISNSLTPINQRIKVMKDIETNTEDMKLGTNFSNINTSKNNIQCKSQDKIKVLKNTNINFDSTLLFRNKINFFNKTSINKAKKLLIKSSRKNEKIENNKSNKNIKILVNQKAIFNNNYKNIIYTLKNKSNFASSITNKSDYAPKKSIKEKFKINNFHYKPNFNNHEIKCIYNNYSSSNKNIIKYINIKPKEKELKEEEEDYEPKIISQKFIFDKKLITNKFIKDGLAELNNNNNSLSSKRKLKIYKLKKKNIKFNPCIYNLFNVAVIDNNSSLEETFKKQTVSNFNNKYNFKFKTKSLKEKEKVQNLFNLIKKHISLYNK